MHPDLVLELRRTRDRKRMPLHLSDLRNLDENIVATLILEVLRSRDDQMGNPRGQQVHVLYVGIAELFRVDSVEVKTLLNRYEDERAQEPLPEVSCMKEEDNIVGYVQ